VNRRVFIGLLFGSAATMVAPACGSARHSDAATGSPAAPHASPEEPSAVTFVVRSGADPAAVARRVAGPGATASPAYTDRRPRENVPQVVMLRSFVVTVPPGQAQEALKRARADPDVQLAYLGRPPGT